MIKQQNKTVYQMTDLNSYNPTSFNTINVSTIGSPKILISPTK